MANLFNSLSSPPGVDRGSSSPGLSSRSGLSSSFRSQNRQEPGELGPSGAPSSSGSLAPLASSASQFSARGGAPPTDESSQMHIQDIQELIRAERLWWSEASERQVKRLQQAMDAQMSKASEQIAVATAQVEDRLMRQLDDEKHERQAALSVMRRDLDAQQVEVTELTRRPRQENSTGLMQVKEEVGSALASLRRDLDDAVNRSAAHQATAGALEAASSGVQRQIDTLRSHQDVKFDNMEHAMSNMRAEMTRATSNQKAAALESAAAKGTGPAELSRQLDELKARQDSSIQRLEGIISNVSSETSQLREQQQQYIVSLQETQSVQRADQSALRGTMDLGRGIEQVSNAVTTIERSLRHEIETLRREQSAGQAPTGALKEIQDQHSSLKQQIQSLSVGLQQAQASQAVVESLSAGLQASQSAAIAVKDVQKDCAALKQQIMEEQAARAQDGSELRTTCANLSALIDNKFKAVLSTLETQHKSAASEDQVSQVSQASSINANRLSEEILRERVERTDQWATLQNKVAALQQSEDLARRSQALSQSEEVAKKVEAEREERRAEMVALRTQLERQMIALVQEVHATSTSANSGTKTPSTISEHNMASLASSDCGDLMVHDERAMGRERAALGGRGEFAGMEALAMRLSALEVEVRHQPASVANGVSPLVLSRVQIIEQNLESIRSQCLRFESSLSRVDALEAGFACLDAARGMEAEQRRHPTVPAQSRLSLGTKASSAEMGGPASTLPPDRFGAGSIGPKALSPGPTLTEPGPGSASPLPVLNAPEGPLTEIAPQGRVERSVSPVGRAAQSAAQRSARSPSPSPAAVPASASTVVLQALADPAVTPRPDRPALFNADLKESLESLVTKVNSALLGNLEPDAKVKAAGGASRDSDPMQSPGAVRTPLTPRSAMRDPSTLLNQLQSNLALHEPSSSHSTGQVTPSGASNAPSGSNAPATPSDGSGKGGDSRKVFQKALQELLEGGLVVQSVQRENSGDVQLLFKPASEGGASAPLAGGPSSGGMSAMAAAMASLGAGSGLSASGGGSSLTASGGLSSSANSDSFRASALGKPGFRSSPSLETRQPQPCRNPGSSGAGTPGGAGSHTLPRGGTQAMSGRGTGVSSPTSLPTNRGSPLSSLRPSGDTAAAPAGTHVTVGGESRTNKEPLRPSRGLAAGTGPAMSSLLNRSAGATPSRGLSPGQAPTGAGSVQPKPMLSSSGPGANTAPGAREVPNVLARPGNRLSGQMHGTVSR